MALKDHIQVRTFRGQPIRRDDFEITPVSQALFVNLPFYHLVWSRPVAVLVSSRGREERLPIVDITKIVQIVLLAIGGVSALLALSWGRIGKNSK